MHYNGEMKMFFTKQTHYKDSFLTIFKTHLVISVTISSKYIEIIKCAQILQSNMYALQR